MIIAGFTGQLKDWWDNDLTQEQRGNILNAVKREQEFLKNQWYKDVFLCRVMELPECNDTHWKSKFIDGLPALFAERVKKALRKGEASINYDNYTYGKLIGTCMQEGLALCNEIKLNQQIKRHGLNERQQLGEFCGQFEPEDSGFESDNSEDSSSNEDLRVLENESYTSTSSDEECAPCQMGQPCTKGNKEEDEFYNLFSQYQDTNINVLDGNNLVDLLKTIKDPELRSQIIDKVNESPKKPKMQIGIQIQESPGPYTMSEVKKLLQQRRNIITTPATTQDLEKEIDNLKQEISTLKQHNMILDEKISRIEDRGKQFMEIPADKIVEDTSVEGSTSKEREFLKTLEFITSQKFFL
ncbi:uncharacterized protein LOC132637884 [Lycium barbarum]|uniref:uncharacterized protein LOC132637884 n=1 Tax=Lycium barbarum TaxID=112863 RepID=UPI00293EA089|nr:uncharacterized protein LOC132637884 [Lycium barbarum]